MGAVLSMRPRKLESQGEKMGSKRPRSVSNGRDQHPELEEAIESYEVAIARAAPGRHALPDDYAEEHLHNLRMNVIRLAEALPTMCWPRPICEQCGGQRKVLAPRSTGPDASENHKFSAVLRLCQACWGVGLTLYVSQADEETR